MKKTLKSNSETITENLFRDYYGPNMFIEKTAIPRFVALRQKKEQIMQVIRIFIVKKKIFV